MAKNKFTFTTAEGVVETRSTERVYTHVVVHRANVAAIRDEAKSKDNAVAWKKDFRFALAMATCEVGAIPKVEGGWKWPLTQDQKDEYSAKVAEYVDADDYAAKRLQERLDQITKHYGDVDVGPEYVAQWSMSEANARKGAKSSPYLASVRVAPVDQK